MMNNNLRKKITFSFVIFFGISILLLPINAYAAAETLGDLRKDYESLLAEKRAAERKSDAAKAEIAQKEAAIKKAENDLNEAEIEQKEAEEKIEESNKNIESLKLESEKVLLYMQQMQSENAYVEYVTGSSSMTELITRIEAVKQITAYIQDTVNNLKNEIKANEDLKKELEIKQKELEEQIVKYENTIAKLHNDAASYDKFALGLDERIQIAKDAYETNKKICLNNIGKTDDSVKLSSCTKMPANGQWLKPLNSGVTTSTVGSRWGSYHNALDIGGNKEGTPVYAAAAGQVAGKINRYWCGGNMLYINVNVGGQQYTTYYYHLLRFNVDVGDVVTQGTIIGYVGGGASTSKKYGGYDSCTTGAHLHYGVQKGFYNSRTGIVRSNVITPPGFPNRTGYRFTSRYDYYQG